MNVKINFQFMLRYIVAAFVAVMQPVAGLSMTLQQQAQGDVYGDVNGDGVVDVDDLNDVINVMLHKPHSGPRHILVDEDCVEFIAPAGHECKQTIMVSGDNLHSPVCAEIIEGDGVFTVSPSVLELDAVRMGAELEVTYAPGLTGTHTARLALSSEDADTVVVTLLGRATQDDGINCQEFPLVVSKEYYDLNGSAVAAGSEAYLNTGKVALPVNCDRVRVCTNTTYLMSAITWFDANGAVMGTLVVSKPLTRSTQTFDVSIPAGAVAMACSTCQSETFRCVAYNSATWHDDWLSGVLIFGDSITKSTIISLNDDQNATATYMENAPTSSLQIEQANPRYLWPSLFRQAIPTVDMRNYAESGAHWCDFAITTPLQQLSKQIQVAASDTQMGSIFYGGDFEPEIIIFALGTNDATFIGRGMSTLGDVASALEKPREELDMSVFCDAMRKALEDARSHWPQARIYCVLPLQCADNNAQVLALHDPMVAMCEALGVQIIDATYQSGIQPSSFDQTLRDGLHPNTVGQRKLADLIIRCIANEMER